MRDVIVRGCWQRIEVLDFFIIEEERCSKIEGICILKRGEKRILGNGKIKEVENLRQWKKERILVRVRVVERIKFREELVGEKELR